MDISSNAEVDLVEDVGLLPSFQKESVSSIYASHILEHFSHEIGSETTNCIQVLSRWFELLKPGGELFVAVPNMKNIFREILRHPGRKESLGFFMAIYGGQNYPFNVHYSGYTQQSLTELLVDVGFYSVAPFKPFVNDTTKFQIQGVQMSLNLRALKSAKNENHGISLEKKYNKIKSFFQRARFF